MLGATPSSQIVCTRHLLMALLHEPLIIQSSFNSWTPLKPFQEGVACSFEILEAAKHEFFVKRLSIFCSMKHAPIISMSSKSSK
jgi:hypothetical protein